METRCLKRTGGERSVDGCAMARRWASRALALLALGALGVARELDPAACSARFDVQRDKIIRTEESREMGARYLAELDVGARQECLRLCCETDSCDVFVYEEKSPGSCYLFACGPPEDFRCKFTAHGNFSSGVLAVARRRAEQQDRARLAEHEQALANLRSATSSTASTSTSTTPPPPPPPPPTPAPAPQLPPPRRCSRYQFECHSGGECIAVYNACDGVPQCADGSDEAPELGCPAAPPQPRSTAAPAPPQEPLRPQVGSAVYNAGDGVPQCADGSDEAPELGCPAAPPQPRSTAAPTPPQEPLRPQVGNAVYNAGDGVPQCADGSDEAPELGCPVAPPQPRSTAAPAPPQEALRAQESNELRLQKAAAAAGVGAAGGGAGGGGVGGERWPHRLAQAQPHRYSPSDAGNGLHIFSHKGGLLQEPVEGAAPFLEPQPAWPRAPWPQPQPVMDSGWGGYARLDWPEPDPRRAWPVPQPRPEPDIPVYIPSKTMPELPLAYGAGGHTLRDAPKKGPPPAQPRAEPPDTAVAEPHKQEVAPVVQPVHTSETPHGAGADIEVRRAAAGAHAPHLLRDERDGLSDHPPAAVLLLVLGVLMTAAMAVLAGCRARAARRRLRRGKSPFAHDADYLVNGMYL